MHGKERRVFVEASNQGIGKDKRRKSAKFKGKSLCADLGDIVHEVLYGTKPKHFPAKRPDQSW